MLLNQITKTFLAVNSKTKGERQIASKKKKKFDLI